MCAVKGSNFFFSASLAYSPRVDAAAVGEGVQQCVPAAYIVCAHRNRIYIVQRSCGSCQKTVNVQTVGTVFTSCLHIVSHVRSRRRSYVRTLTNEMMGCLVPGFFLRICSCFVFALPSCTYYFTVRDEVKQCINILCMYRATTALRGLAMEQGMRKRVMVRVNFE